MSLAPRTRLGPYEIVERIAAGGMGEVYRARDTRLDRTVAIKVLRSELTGRDAVRQRFEREARAISALNHPHICTLHDVGREEGIDFLVLELVEGESLAERLTRGPLAPELALRTAIEIASALDRAHRSGVVHRDLKPANVMLTSSGAKLVDFGLAKRRGVLAGEERERSEEPALTEEGSLLGTLNYMAPEQLHGAESDARSDLFAFGALLYEMLTGARAFPGESSASVIAAILNQEPRALRELQPLAPAALDRAVRECLAKDPEERWQNARDLMHELEWIASGAAGDEQQVAPPRGGVLRERIAWTLALALGAAALVLATLLARNDAGAARSKVHLALPHTLVAPFTSFDDAALSPDGRRIALVVLGTDGTTRLVVRELDGDAARELEGTSGATLPFWSPNGRFLGFFAEGKLQRIDADGGPAQVLSPASAAYGGTWSPEGAIVFSAGTELLRVPESGGAAVSLTHLNEREEAHRWPCFLPDGRHFVFLGDAAQAEDHHLEVGSLDGGPLADLGQAISNVVYAEPGYLLYVRGGDLLARPFDAATLRWTGDPISIASSLVESEENHHFDFSVAGARALVYRSASRLKQFAWVDRKGAHLADLGSPARMGNAALSNDARSIAYETLDRDGRSDGVSILDLEHGVTSRLTPPGTRESDPVWSPDDQRVACARWIGLGADLYAEARSGGRPAELLFSSREQKWPQGWSADGRILFFGSTPLASTRAELWALRLDDPNSAWPVVQAPASAFAPAPSPDGSWLAYLSNESGRDELYVQAFPTAARRWQVSNRGAAAPCWRADGRELFFLDSQDSVVSCAIRAGDTFEFEPPRELFQTKARLVGVAQDGERLLVVRPIENVFEAPLDVVLDWTAGLQRH